jgi:membrane protein implicated in regulation of membrane protease activity
VVGVPWYIWIISALGLFIAEIFTPGFVLACFGVASLVTGLLSFLGVGLQGQIVTFSISTIVVFFGIRPVFLKYFDTSIRTVSIEGTTIEVGEKVTVIRVEGTKVFVKPLAK